MRSTVAVAIFAALILAPLAAAVPDGGQLYFTHCASCHGISANGDGPDANLFLPAPRSLRGGFLEDHATPELLRLILDGARRPLALDPVVLRVRLKDTEALVTHLEEIPDVNWNLFEIGQILYIDRCRDCHGLFGRPVWDDASTPAPPDLSTRAFQARVSDDQLLDAVRHGRPGMPAIPALRSDADAHALVAFVRVLSPGFELYSRHCASCHGSDGHPTQDFAKDRRPTVVFDRDWLARRDPTQLRAAATHMLEERQPGMPHFRKQLSEPAARAIIEYLRSTN